MACDPYRLGSDGALFRPVIPYKWIGGAECQRGGEKWKLSALRRWFLAHAPFNPSLTLEESGFPMRVDDSSSGLEAARFQTTCWTRVMVSARNQSQAGRAAWAELYQLYWYPLYAFARRRGHSPPDAQDLTQGFFLHLVERQGLSQVNRLKGRFRSFLLACFQNYLSVEAQRAHCLKRGGRCQWVFLDAESAENRYRLEPVDQLTAETIFEARWALTLLEHALTALGRQYALRHKEAVFETLKGFVGVGVSGTETSYEAAANALGMGVGTVKTLIHRLRKQYLAVVREEVARTVSDPGEIEGELHALCHALIASEGRLGP
jgi:RNA polymerase sigma factor (sigma-70 family)